MKRFWLVLGSFCLYAVLVVLLGLGLRLPGPRLVVFNLVLLLLGLLAAGITLWYLKKVAGSSGTPLGASESSKLEALVREASEKLRASGRADLRSLASLPLVYLIGDENSAKTQTVLQSGLEPELLAGEVFRDGAVLPTPAANIWLTGSAALVEAGGALLREPALWERLVQLTAPAKLGAAISRSAQLPTRAVVVCVSMERLLAPNTAQQIRTLAQTLNQRLRQLSQVLGISLPVYVLFTKLDRVGAFAEYTANLSPAEVTMPLGARLSLAVDSAGLYAERAAQEFGTRFDEVNFLLSEFRLEVLSRGGEQAALATAYEFPRSLQKLRGGLVDFLVELARPSQLGVNPFLRGFFFSGMRAHVVQDVLPAAAQPVAAPTRANAGATQVFSFAQQAAPVPVVRSSVRKVAQWVFLPHLFSRLVLADKSALDASRNSTRVSGLKRSLLAGLTALLLAYLLLLTISFFRNRQLEAEAAAAARPVQPVAASGVATVADLQTLEQLRQVLVKLDGYRQDGPPLLDRWGLYRGEAIRRATCSAYGERFKTLLLRPTQASIQAKFSALPLKASPTDEYQATYKPLKALLITTTNPEKSTVDFLAPVLQAEWMGTRAVSPEQQQLALPQFEYYAAALPQPGSCLGALSGRPDAGLIANTRAYLNSFAGIDHVYLSIKSAADRKFPAIDFKKLYPNSVRLVAAPTVVDGAFSKAGFGFMQDAIRNPDPYLSGEEWVTGPSTATVDRGTLRQQLETRFQDDFLTAWRTFLKTARVLPFGSTQDATLRLHELDGPGSPLLQIFGVVARNTSVPDPAFSQPFQAPQSVVPPGTGPAVNPGYTEKLGAIEQALHQMLSTSGTTPDPTQVNTAVGAAYGAVSSLRGGFQPPDPSGIADANSERLLREPIHSVEDLAGKVPAKAANGAGADLCKQAAGVLGKFPFNPDAHQDASPEETAAFFSPSGPIAQFAAAQSKLVAFNGSIYTAVPGAQINPALLTFLNATRVVETTLFPNGSPQPSLSFSITQQATPNLAPATLEVDGTALAGVGTPAHVTWQYKPAGSVKLAGSGQTKNNFGPWSIFHFAFAAKHPSPNRLEYIFQNNGITEKSPTGVDIIYQFELEDAGARLLNPDFMRRQLHCVATVAR